MNQLIKPTMSSREIAEQTERPHSDVLKAIRKMEIAWKKVTGGNFSLSGYVDQTGRKLPMYELTKTECLFVATKFNDEARAKLVLRWEELETEKRKPVTSAEQILLQAQILVEQERRLNAIEAKVLTRPNYFTVVGYASMIGIRVSTRQASSLGRKASVECKKRGYAIDTIPDPRFGRVNLYPESVLEYIFDLPIN